MFFAVLPCQEFHRQREKEETRSDMPSMHDAREWVVRNKLKAVGVSDGLAHLADLLGLRCSAVN